jgi:hypothetical protein
MNIGAPHTAGPRPLPELPEKPPTPPHLASAPWQKKDKEERKEECNETSVTETNAVPEQSGPRRQSLSQPQTSEPLGGGQHRNFTEQLPSATSAPRKLEGEAGSAGDANPRRKTNWQYEGANDLHGPTYRFSPPKKQNQRQRGYSKQSNSNTDCPNTFPKGAHKHDPWSHVKCDCDKCLRRNRSVYVIMDNPPTTQEKQALYVAFSKYLHGYAIIEDLFIHSKPNLSTSVTGNLL